MSAPRPSAQSLHAELVIDCRMRRPPLPSTAAVDSAHLAPGNRAIGSAVERDALSLIRKPLLHRRSQSTGRTSPLHVLPLSSLSSSSVGASGTAAEPTDVIDLCASEVVTANMSGAGAVTGVAGHRRVTSFSESTVVGRPARHHIPENTAIDLTGALAGATASVAAAPSANVPTRPAGVRAIGRPLGRALAKSHALSASSRLHVRLGPPSSLSSSSTAAAAASATARTSSPLAHGHAAAIAGARPVRGFVPGSSTTAQIRAIFESIRDAHHFHEGEISTLVASSSLADAHGTHATQQRHREEHELALAMAMSLAEAGADPGPLAPPMDHATPGSPYGNLFQAAHTAADSSSDYEHLVQLEDVKVGLSWEEIEAFPLLIVGETTRLNAGEDDGQCVICMEDLKYGSLVRMLPCQHAEFCAECIEKWLGENKKCPICKKWLQEE